VGEGRARWSSGRAKNRAGSVYNRSLPPPPRTLGPASRNPRVPGQVRSKSGSAGPGLFVTDLSLPHPPRRARSAWMPGPVTDRRGALCTGFTLVYIMPTTGGWLGCWFSLTLSDLILTLSLAVMYRVTTLNLSSQFHSHLAAWFYNPSGLGWTESAMKLLSESIIVGN
jgi:hypothetical protein